MTPNKDLIRRILTSLNQPEIQRDWTEIDGSDHPEFAEHLRYLHGHKLIRADIIFGTQGEVLDFIGAGLSTKGIDYLQPDGGLTTDFAANTIKLHPDTISSLTESIASIIQQPGVIQLDESALEQIRTVLLEVIDERFPPEHAKTLRERAVSLSKDVLQDAVTSSFSDAVKAGVGITLHSLLAQLGMSEIPGN